MFDLFYFILIVVGFLAWVAADYAHWRWSYRLERDRLELRRQSEAWRAILRDIDDRNAGIVKLVVAKKEERR